MRNVTLVGNVTREVELKALPTGQEVSSFGLAVNENWTGKDGEKMEKVHFVDISAWGSLASNVADSINKGMRVVVVGRLDYQSWEDKDGNKRSAVKVVADEVSPSLRWASAEVTKNDRPDAGTYAPAGAERYAPSQRGGQPVQPSLPSDDPGPQAPPPEFDYDEEPF